MCKFHWPYVVAYTLLCLASVLAEANRRFTLWQDCPRLGPNDVAVITGGLRGLGLELVKRLVFHYRLRHVYIVDKCAPQFCFESPYTIVDYVACDLLRPLEARTVARDLVARAGTTHPILVLINNAGVRMAGPLLEMSDADVDTAFGVNARAHVPFLQHVVGAHLAAIKEASVKAETGSSETASAKSEIDSAKSETDSAKSGSSLKLEGPPRLSVVTVLLVLGSFGARNLLLYLASKAASTQLHECLAQELRAVPSVRMLLVTPGQMTTAMFSDLVPDRLFWAPLVSHVQLAGRILACIDKGVLGTISEPLYANLLPALKVLPMCVQQWARDFSRMDEKMLAKVEDVQT